jgi:hypothetical protein
MVVPIKIFPMGTTPLKFPDCGTILDRTNFSRIGPKSSRSAALVARAPE